MPNCFTLTRKGEDKPEILQNIDRELWEYFEGEEPEKNDCWYQNWYNCIGLTLAMGKTLDHCMEIFSEELGMVALYLEEHFTVNAWASR